MSSPGPPLRVRPATPGDAPQITRVHASDVEIWYRWKLDLTKVEAKREDLSPWERYMLGGWWLEEPLCRAHLEKFLQLGQWPLVAELDGRIIGEMEVIVGPDPGWGWTAHIDALVVERGFRHQGAGRALVEEGRRLALEAGCSSYTLCPEDTAVGFYRKCGLTDVWARQRDVRVPLGEGSALRPWDVRPGDLRSFTPLEGLPLRLGRFQTSYDEWIKGPLVLAEYQDRLLREEGSVPELGGYYRLRPDPRSPTNVFLNAWGPPEVKISDLLGALSSRARLLGYQTLLTTIDLGDLPLTSSWELSLGPESIILGSSLRTRP